MGVARIALTYHVFTQTYDEPAHVACGMEWLDRGTYTYEHNHPPLARVAAAVGPYLLGLRSKNLPDQYEEGNRILYDSGSYKANLTAARLGILPFFVISCAVVWFWSRRLYGHWIALATTALFSTLPPILANAGLVTTDMAVTAFLAASLYATVLWLEKPSLGRSMWMGAAAALAVLSKLSAVVFFLPCVAVLLLLRPREQDNQPLRFSPKRRIGLAVGFLAFFLIVWAAYRFSLGPMWSSGSIAHTLVDHVTRGEGSLHDLGDWVIERPLPAPELITGLKLVWKHNQEGQGGYLLGEYRTTGWWYFFLVVLAVKTPLAFLILVFLGCFACARQPRNQDRWMFLAPSVWALVILLLCLLSRLNFGVRHILPIYPMLAIIAAAGLSWLLNSGTGKRVLPSVAVVLLLWQFTVSALIHPDYLAYFNELAGDEPDRVLVESDLDWGQDLDRLSERLRVLGVKDVALRYFGTADLRRHNLPRIHTIDQFVPKAGWIAISLTRLRRGGLKAQHWFKSPTVGYSWLEKYRPVEAVGKSIRLYHIPAEELR